MKRICWPAILLLALMTFIPRPGYSQLASEPLYDLEFVDLYAELFPDKREAFIIAQIYLVGNGSDPVLLRCDGNFKHVKATVKDGQESYIYRPPYFWFEKLASGSQIITFEYQVEHFGLATSGAIISPEKLDLGAGSFWYPRNNASDPHQVLLNVDTSPAYALTSNGTTTRDISNNLKRLRTFVLRDSLAEGLTLSGGNP